MKKFLFFSLLLTYSLSYSQTLLETINLPTGTFYTQAYGLVYNDGKYWISSGSSTSGNGLIKAVNSSGIEVDQITFNYPVMRYSQGLAHDGTYFWYLERRGSTHSLFKVDASGNVLDSIKIFGTKYLGGAGWDGTGVWVSCYYPNNEAALYKVDVSTKTIVDTIQTFGIQPQGITVKGDTLFYVMDGFDGDDERIYAVKLPTKENLFSFHVPELPGVRQNPRGLAWDGTYFWLLAEPVGASSGRQLFKYDLGGSGTPAITVPVTTINFPNTTVGNTYNYNLTIYSTGTATLTLDSITVSGNSFSINPLSFPINIPAGGSQDVTVNFTPTAYAFYQGLLKVYNNDPIKPIVNVNLRGQGVLSGPRIGLSAASHNFGTVWVGQEGIAFWNFKVFNMGDQTLQISDLQFDLPEFTYNAPAVPFQIFSTDTLDLTAYFYPTQVGNYLDTLKITNNDVTNPVAKISFQGIGMFSDYNYGYMFWEFQVPPHGSSSAVPKVEGLKYINDITGDGIPEVIIATENYWVMCLDGAASGITYPLWTFSSCPNNNNCGSIGANFEYGVQDAIQIASDLNGDGFNDVVIATGGGNEHVYALDGRNGQIIWKYGDDINWSLGDFEAVDVRRDFTGDGIPDVLAIADGNDQGTGYKRAYLFNGTNGNIVWEHYYPGPNPSFGKTIISIEDLNGDNLPDAVIAYGNNGTTNLAVRALNGINGQELWTRPMVQYEPKELLELPLPGGGSDVIAAEYFNRIHRLNGINGNIVWTQTLGTSAGMIEIGLINDVNGDQIPDILIASFASNGLNCLSGATGAVLWSWQMDYQFGVASVPDINKDGIDDVVAAARYGNFYCISGKGDSLIFMHSFPGDWVFTAYRMPSIDGNYSYELLAGTRNGKVVCFSGGIDFVTIIETENLSDYPEDFNLFQNYPNPFNPATTISYSIKEKGMVTLKVFDILGKEVATLLNEEQTAGSYKIEFNASSIASGIYFYSLKAGNFIATKKMVLLR
jgi:hypothetical protein